MQRLGPGMVRVVFGGDDMHDYPTTGVGDEFVQLRFPEHPGDEVLVRHDGARRGVPDRSGGQSDADLHDP